ncbi:MAG: phosphate acyltransferase [Gemmatimonadota bacterium]
MSFRAQLRERARGLGARIVLPEGTDLRVQAAAEIIRREKIGEPILLGESGIVPSRHPALSRVADLLRRRRPERVRDGVHALDLAADPIRLGAGLVALGEADGCLAGAVTPTADVIRAALWAIGTDARGLLSSAFYLGLPDGRVITFTDCAVVVDPDPDELAAIAVAAANDRRRLAGDEPVVAFLSYSTQGSAAGPAVDKVRDALERFRALAPGVAADGELQVDAALVPEVARRKAPGSVVAGAANVLVFPNLDAGNIAYKLVERLAGATATGPVFQGLSRPMSDLSRGATADDIVDSAAIAALQAQTR